MYAVIKSGGKQYRVKEGQKLKLEKLVGDVDSVINFDNVLMVADGENITIGEPLVAKAKVEAKVVSHGRHKKVKIIKFRRRKHSMSRMGHRQDYTEVEITKIVH